MRSPRQTSSRHSGVDTERCFFVCKENLSIGGNRLSNRRSKTEARKTSTSRAGAIGHRGRDQGLQYSAFRRERVSARRSAFLPRFAASESIQQRMTGPANLARREESSRTTGFRAASPKCPHLAEQPTEQTPLTRRQHWLDASVRRSRKRRALFRAHQRNGRPSPTPAFAERNRRWPEQASQTRAKSRRLISPPSTGVRKFCRAEEISEYHLLANLRATFRHADIGATGGRAPHAFPLRPTGRPTTEPPCVGSQHGSSARFRKTRGLRPSTRLSSRAQGRVSPRGRPHCFA